MPISTRSPSCQQGSSFPTSYLLCLFAFETQSFHVPQAGLELAILQLSYQGLVQASLYLSHTSRRKCRSFHRTVFLKLNFRNLAPGLYVLGFGQSLREIIKYIHHNHTSSYIRCKYFSLGTALNSPSLSI